MSFTCTLSGEAAETPVVSPVSGHIFEKRLIVKFIAENGTDPVTGSKLSEDELVELKAPPPEAAPRTVAAASIPQLLKTLQDEWDACMLNSFTLRQHLQLARQELSHSLYQHDAACRVIARLTKELTGAREALSTLKPHGTHAAEADVDMERSVEEGTGMSDSVIKKLDDKSKTLTAARKQRGKSMPEHLAKPETIQALKLTASNNAIHSTGTPGITALDVQDNLVLTGGADKTVALYDSDKEQVLTTLKGHSKKINAVILHPNKQTIVSCASDAQVRVWSASEENCRAVLDTHQASVTGISLHATGDFVLSVSDDGHWAFSDIVAGKTLCKVRSDDAGAAIGVTSAQFHPDGLIFGTGTADSVVKIWDLKQQTNVANFPGHTGAVRAIAFSENGYYLASGADDGELRLWDLRKLKNLKSLAIQDGKFPINDVFFDESGTFLGVAANTVNIIHVKPWTTLATYEDSQAAVSGVRFGTNASSVFTASMDKNLRIYK